MTERHEPRGFDPETLAGAGFPTISYDGLTVGEEFRSDDRLIRPQDIEMYAFAVEDHDPLFFEPGPFGAPVAHPTLLANQALFLRHNRYLVPAGLHARMVFEFLAPVPLGVRARTTGRLADKYVRRDKPYMVTDFVTSAEGGEAMIRGRFVQMLFRETRAPAPGTANRTEDRPPPVDPSIVEATGRSGVIRVGEELAPVERRISQRRIDCYSGVRPGSIHSDPDWAREKGFPSTIAQGMMSTAYVSSVMTSALGAGFIVGGRMDVRFLQPVHEGDTLTTTGRVTGFRAESTGPDQGRIRLYAALEIHNQHGALTLSGTAGGLAADDPSNGSATPGPP